MDFAGNFGWRLGNLAAKGVMAQAPHLARQRSAWTRRLGGPLASGGAAILPVDLGPQQESPGQSEAPPTSNTICCTDAKRGTARLERAQRETARMPSIRRTLKAALWGVPGPAIVGCMIAGAIAFAAYYYRRLNHLGDDSPTVSAEALWLGLIPAAESTIGAVYGLMRRANTAFNGGWRRLNLVHGALIDTCVWGIVGSTILLIAAGLAAVALALDHYGDFLLVSGLYFAHLACGAIAGFHVEYYLLHGREPDDAVS